MFTNLLSYIRLKKFTLSRFYFIFTFLLLFVIVINLKGFNISKISRILKILRNSRYNKFLTIY